MAGYWPKALVKRGSEWSIKRSVEVSVGRNQPSGRQPLGKRTRSGHQREPEGQPKQADEEIRTLDPLLGKEMLYH